MGENFTLFLIHEQFKWKEGGAESFSKLFLIPSLVFSIKF